MFSLLWGMRKTRVRPQKSKDESKGRGTIRARISKKSDSEIGTYSRKSKIKPNDRLVDLKPKAKTEAVLMGFSELWRNLFTTPIHLDSALSKLSVNIKSILAQIFPSILLRPASQAEALGVGVSPGEPWNLEGAQLAGWRPPLLMAERLYEMMVQKGVGVQPIQEDFPPQMISEWIQEWGPQILSDLIDTLGREAPLGLRASRRVGAQAVLSGLTEGSRLPVKAELSQLVPLGVCLSGYAPVLGTELYKKGAFEIQDEGSQFIALFALWPERYVALLKDHPGRIQKLERLPPPPPKDTPAWNIIDACAGAGGKSLAMGDALKGKGRVYAYDISETKLRALRRRATHAGLNNIQTVLLKENEEAGDLLKFTGTAQVVLVDAPCSGWGVLRRNPDIKWRQKLEVLSRMPEIQLRLLQLYSKLVSPEGRLVYAVCTFRIAETQKVIQKFLELNSDFSAKEGGYLGPGPCDGFFMQSLVRRSMSTR